MDKNICVIFRKDGLSDDDVRMEIMKSIACIPKQELTIYIFALTS